MSGIATETLGRARRSYGCISESAAGSNPQQTTSFRMRTFRLVKTSVALLIVSTWLPSFAGAQAPVPDPKRRADVTTAGGKLIPADRLRELFTGNTVYWTFLERRWGVPRGSVAPSYHKDDKVRIAPSPRGGGKDQRLWWIEGDAVCFESPSAGEPPSCGLFYELPNSQIYNCARDEDVCRFLIKFSRGNPERY